MASDTSQANHPPRLAISLTQREAVVLVEYLRRLRAGELEGLYSDMKKALLRRGWGPVTKSVPFDAPGAYE